MVSSLTTSGSMCYHSLVGHVYRADQISPTVAFGRLYGLPPKYGDPRRPPKTDYSMRPMLCLVSFKKTIPYDSFALGLTRCCSAAGIRRKGGFYSFPKKSRSGKYQRFGYIFFFRSLSATKMTWALFALVWSIETQYATGRTAVLQ